MLPIAAKRGMLPIGGCSAGAREKLGQGRRAIEGRP